MRDGWVLRPLGEVVRQIHRPVSVATLDVVPFAGVRWYAEGVYPRDEQAAATVKTKALNRIEAGDIVYNRMWATKASFGVVRNDAHGCLVTNDFPVFQATDGALSDFVGLLFKWEPFQRGAAASATGTTERRRLNEKDFVKLQVPVPPLDEQRRIVDLIGALDDTITTAKADSQTVLATRARFLESKFGGVKRLLVRTLVSGIEGGMSPKAIDLAPGAGQEGVLKVSAVTALGFDPRESKTVTDASIFSERHRVRANDVLVTRANTAALVGQVCLVPEDHAHLFLCDKTLRLRPGDGVTPPALVAALNSPMARGQLSAMATGTSASMKNISQVNIGDVRVGWPDDSASVGLADQAFLARYMRSQRVIQSLLDLRSNLIKALLSGDHEIPESYDELMGEAS